MVAGIILSVPGVPGQGLLTMLVGLVLLDIPGKRRLELKLVSRPRVVRAINRLRKRFSRPPLLTTPADPHGAKPVQPEPEHEAASHAAAPRGPDSGASA